MKQSNFLLLLYIVTCDVQTCVMSNETSARVLGSSSEKSSKSGKSGKNSKSSKNSKSGKSSKSSKSGKSSKTKTPSASPSMVPSLTSTESSVPSESPSSASLAPTESSVPSETPSVTPSISTRPSTSLAPTKSSAPSQLPSAIPSISTRPSIAPSNSLTPSETPSMTPSISARPSTSLAPTKSSAPSESPSATPSISTNPSLFPTNSPTYFTCAAFGNNQGASKKYCSAIKNACGIGNDNGNNIKCCANGDASSGECFGDLDPSPDFCTTNCGGENACGAGDFICMLNPPLNSTISDCAEMSAAIDGDDLIDCTVCPAGSQFTGTCKETSGSTDCSSCDTTSANCCTGSTVCCNLGRNPNTSAHLGFQCESENTCTDRLPDYTPLPSSPPS